MIISRTMSLEFQVTAEVKRDGKKVDFADVPYRMDWETDGQDVKGAVTKYALHCDNFTATLCIGPEDENDLRHWYDFPTDKFLEQCHWDEGDHPAELLNSLIWEAIATKHNAALDGIILGEEPVRS